MYECPVYKTRSRGRKFIIKACIHLILIIYLFPATYIWTFNLKTKDKPAKWVLAGVALLLQN